MLFCDSSQAKSGVDKVTRYAPVKFTIISPQCLFFAVKVGYSKSLVAIGNSLFKKFRCV